MLNLEALHVSLVLSFWFFDSLFYRYFCGGFVWNDSMKVTIGYKVMFMLQNPLERETSYVNARINKNKIRYIIFLHAINCDESIIFRVMASPNEFIQNARGTERDRRRARVFPGKKQTSLSTRAVIGAVIASFIWFPAYQGERQAKKIYINIDIDRRGGGGEGEGGGGRGGDIARRYTDILD